MAVLRVERLGGGPVEVDGMTAEAVGGQSSRGGGNARLVQMGDEVEVRMRAPVLAGERQVRVCGGDETRSWEQYTLRRVMPTALEMGCRMRCGCIRPRIERRSGNGSGGWRRCKPICQIRIKPGDPRLFSVAALFVSRSPEGARCRVGRGTARWRRCIRIGAPVAISGDDAGNRTVPGTAGARLRKETRTTGPSRSSRTLMR